MAQLRKPTQKYAKCLQPLRNSFGVVHAIHAKNDEIVSQLPSQLSRGCFHLAAGSVIRKFFEGNAYGKRRDGGPPAFQGDDVVRFVTHAQRIRENALQATEEIVAVTISLKSQQVILQQSTQYGFPPRQFFANIWCRKWNVQEKADARSAASFPEITAHQHEVIVMRPDEVFRVCVLHCDLREFAVYALVELPEFRIEIATRGHVVKQRPDNFIGEAGIKLRHFLLGQ